MSVLTRDGFRAMRDTAEEILALYMMVGRRRMTI